MKMDLNTLLGIVGMILILGGFVLGEFYRKCNQDNYLYNAINVIGSGLLTYYAFTLESIPFIILNGVWCVAASFKIIQLALR